MHFKISSAKSEPFYQFLMYVKMHDDLIKVSRLQAIGFSTETIVNNWRVDLCSVGIIFRICLYLKVEMAIWQNTKRQMIRQSGVACVNIM